MSDGDFRPSHPYLVAIVVSLATFMEVLDTTVTNVSLTHIAGSLGASQDESTWVLTSYLVANGIVLPLSGWLSGIMGRKRFFLTCIAGFTLASFACGIATSLPMLILFRLLQGLAGGGLQPSQQAIITDSFPLEKRGLAFAITGITMIAAPVLGPTLGGFITDSYSWRWIFLMNVPVGILAIFLISSLVQDPPHAKKRAVASFDGIGLGLVAIGIGSLQLVLDKGQEDDWFSSSFIVTFTLIASACLIAAIFWLLRQKEPVVDLKLLAIPTFGLSCVMIFFVGFALYGCSALLPLLVQTQFGYDATLAGLVLSPGGIALIFLMPIAGRLVSCIQARYMIAFGMAVCSLGMWFTMTHITPGTNYETFVIGRILQVVGLPFIFVPNSTLAFSKIPKEKSSNASAIFSLMRNLGGSIGIALLSNLVTRHQQTHQAILGQHLSIADPNYRSMHSAYVQGIGAGGSPSGAAARMYHELLHQSSLLAYQDGFRFVAVVMLGIACIALLMPRNHPRRTPAKATAMAH